MLLIRSSFYFPQRGIAGRGGSSYINTVVLRDKDSTNGWTGSGDGTREQRHYYAQNWRADVSVIVDNAGDIQEWDKYRAYGVPFLLTPADHNKDGAVTKDDSNAFDADYAAGKLRADLNKDGALTTADQTIFNASYAKAVVGGRFKLSASDIANRKGYAGYEHDGNLPELAHVRNRVMHFGLGRWTRRDPLGYVDGVNLYILVVKDDCGDVVVVTAGSAMATCGTAGGCESSSSSALAQAIPYLCSCTTAWALSGATGNTGNCSAAWVNPVVGPASGCQMVCVVMAEETCTGTWTIYIPVWSPGGRCNLGTWRIISVTVPCVKKRWVPATPAATTVIPGTSSGPNSGGFVQCCAGITLPDGTDREACGWLRL